MFKHKCAQCGEVKKAVLFRGTMWCLDCREVEIEKYPPLPETRTRRREFPVQINGKVYMFVKKTEARATARTLLKRKKLPSEIVQQIEEGYRKVNNGGEL